MAASRTPLGVVSGDTNPWDATEFIEHMAYGLAGKPSPEATAALERLIGAAHASYTDTLRHALALQRRGRRDHEYTSATLGQLRAIVENGLPERASTTCAPILPTAFSTSTRACAARTPICGRPIGRAEQAAERKFLPQPASRAYFAPSFPQAIRFEPEMHMPGQKRADIAAIRNRVRSPVEIKGQWHPEVWTAPTEQLAARYTRDWHAEGRGTYIVLWFGDVPGKNLPIIRTVSQDRTRRTTYALCSLTVSRRAYGM